VFAHPLGAWQEISNVPFLRTTFATIGVSNVVLITHRDLMNGPGKLLESLQIFLILVLVSFGLDFELALAGDDEDEAEGSFVSTSNVPALQIDPSLLQQGWFVLDSDGQQQVCFSGFLVNVDQNPS
jgi:hypothetical protein